MVDLFLGSGTTGVACKKLKRRFIGCDVDENAVQVASARLHELKSRTFTGNKGDRPRS